MIPPFSTFNEEERPDNPLVQDMLSYMNDDSLYSITWDFTTFPSQEFKNQLGSYLLEYAQEIWNGMKWFKRRLTVGHQRKPYLHSKGIYGAETEMFLPCVLKGRLYRRWKKLLKRDLRY